MDIPGMASKYRVVRFRNESSRQTLVKHQFLDPPLTICRGIFPKKKIGDQSATSKDLVTI